MSDFETLDWWTDPSVLGDPYPYYEFVRAKGPVWREPAHGFYVVTGYQELFEIQRDYERFSSCNSFGAPVHLPEQPEGDDANELIEKHREHFPFYDNLLNFDPPKHTDHRGLMMRLLTPKGLRKNEQFMRRLADEQIDAFLARGRCDFITEYAHAFAALVIIDLMGVPHGDLGPIRDSLKARGVAGGLGGKFEGDNLLANLEEWFIPYIEDRRREPRDDVLTSLAVGKFGDGSTPKLLEAVRVATVLFAGGQGTAARFLGNALKFVAENPDIQQKLRREPERIPDFIEELLRFDSPTKVNFRMARVTTKVGGVEIPAGSNIMMFIPAANRDPRHFERPNEFDLDRPNAREHVAFGRGVHSCPGQPLVRSEGRITLERMLERMGDIRLSESEHGPPEARRFEYSPSYILHGLEALHLEFEPIQ